MSTSYPPNSPYVNREGYYGHLTEQQQQTLQDLQQWVVDSDIALTQLAGSITIPQFVLLRYLRASDFDLVRTQTLIVSNMKWREEEQVHDILAYKIEDIIGCDIPQILAVYPHWHYGYDKVGRPVLYKQYGKFEITKAKQLTTIDALVKYHIWEQEACMFMCKEQSRRTGFVVETVTVVIDIQNMQLRQANRDFLAVIKRVADIDQRRYPETLGALYIINAPALFNMVWSVVKVWIDPKTAQKFHILSKEEMWRPILERDIGLDNLPADYGGRGTNLELLQNPYSDVFRDLEESKSPRSARDIYRQPSRGRLSRESSSSSQFFDTHISPFDDWDEELRYVNTMLGSERALSKLDDIAKTIVKPKVFDRFCLRVLSSKSSHQLRTYLTYAVGLYILLSLLALIIGSYVLSSMFWVSNLVQWQMWTSVLVVCLAAWLTVLNFTGFIGVKYKHRMLLRGYTFVLGLVAFVFLLLAVVCFAYASGNRNVTNVSEQALSETLPSSVNANEALHRMRRFNLMLGSVCLACSLFSCVPISIASVLSWKLRDDKETPPQGKQLRAVLLLSNTLDMLYSIVIIGYAAYAVQYVLQESVLSALFALYLVLLSGFALLILTCIGMWAACTKWSWTVRLYKYLVIPVLLVLLCDTIQTSWILTFVDRDITTTYHHRRNAAEIAAKVKIQLLVSGILCSTACVLEVISLVSASQLYAFMKNKTEKTRRSFPEHLKDTAIPIDDDMIVVEASPLALRSVQDKLVIAWAIVAGLEDIFVRGTYVIFNKFIAEQPSWWMVAVWHSYGEYDKRYIESDSFVISIEGIMALIVGPCSLLFAWMVCVGAPHRHQLGLVVTVLNIYTQILSYSSITLAKHSHHISLNSQTVFWTLFVIDNIVRFVCPALVFLFLWRQLTAIVKRAESPSDLPEQSQSGPAEVVEQAGQLRHRCSAASAALDSQAPPPKTLLRDLISPKAVTTPKGEDLYVGVVRHLTEPLVETPPAVRRSIASRVIETEADHPL